MTDPYWREDNELRGIRNLEISGEITHEESEMFQEGILNPWGSVLKARKARRNRQDEDS